MRKIIVSLVFVFVALVVVWCVPQQDLPVVTQPEDTQENNEEDTNGVEENEGEEVDEADTEEEAEGDIEDDNAEDNVEEDEANADDEEVVDEEAPEEGDEEAVVDGDMAMDGRYEFDMEQTEVTWEAWKVVWGHEGVINMKEWFAEFENWQLVAGEAVIDMTTMRSTDNGGSEGLDNHLKNDDFFSVETFPTASLVITAVEYSDETTATVTADMTIRGITNSETFEVTFTDSGFTAEVMIDRTAYDVTYNSSNFFKNLGDRAIKDEFALRVDATLVAAN